MNIPIIALEGPDGAGKTEHARRLANALSDRGYTAILWHHPAPPAEFRGDPWACAVHYAMERAKLRAYLARNEYAPWPKGVTVTTVAGDGRPRVVIADRWHWSTRVLGEILVDRDRDDDTGWSLDTLYRSEVGVRHAPTLTVLLTAPAGVLCDRLAARGETVDAVRVAETVEWYQTTCRDLQWPTIDTTRDADSVARNILYAATKALRGVR